ncbi:MAG: ATP-binding protein [Colwellia sp.]|nr:ATP-binding protein [Colwellia sp.]
MYDRIEKNYYNEDDICSVFAKYIDIESPKKITLKLVFNYFNDNWHFLIGKAHLDEQPVSENLIYPDLAFVSMVIEVSNFKEFISDLQKNGISYSDKYPRIKPENLNWKEKLIPKTHAIQRPIRSFETSIVENSNTFQDKQLFAYKQPYSNSSKELVKNYIGMQTFHGSSDSRAGKLVIEFFDHRGCLFIEDSQLWFESNEPAFMTGEIVYAEDKEVISSDDTTTLLRVNLQEASSCDVFLVNQQNEVLDFITSSLHYEFSISVADKKNESLLADLIQGGENEHVEFKTFIGLEKGSKKKEIDKTVCAFSNQSGGVLFIGVTDGAEIIGLEGTEFGRQFKNDSQSYSDAISNYLTERLRINNCFNVLHTSVCGEDIIVVEVSIAGGCNQITADKVVYIRKGASSMQATPEEILSLTTKHKKILIDSGLTFQE